MAIIKDSSATPNATVTFGNLSSTFSKSDIKPAGKLTLKTRKGGLNASLALTDQTVRSGDAIKVRAMAVRLAVCGAGQDESGGGPMSHGLVGPIGDWEGAAVAVAAPQRWWARAVAAKGVLRWTLTIKLVCGMSPPRTSPSERLAGAAARAERRFGL